MESRSADAEVLRRSLADPSAFAEIYARHGLWVRRYVARRSGDNASEDIAAEVFERAFHGRRAYRPEYDTALPWLLGISNKVIANHRRLERRRLAALERWAKAQPLSVDHPDCELAPELMRALRRLPASDRDALLLVVWGELSYEEAAGALGVPVGTVSSRVTRARQRLSHALTPSADTSTTELQLTGEANA